MTLLAFLFLFTACDIEKEPFIQDAESEKAILSFVVDSVAGVIDESALTVTLTFPQGVDVSHLTPVIKVSAYATIQPESGVEQDFTNPVIYTVTAFDGSTVAYQVSAVISDPENEKSILSFTVEDPACEGLINENEKTIMLAFPVGTDLTHLVPTIEVSEGATVDPASGVEQDFSNPVVYTVTALNGSAVEYTVTAIVADEPWEATGKTVLIKDFTGARCVNCPDAAEYAHNLQHQLGEDRVFILSVHAGYLAQPVGFFPDFITPEGDEWYAGNTSNPLFCVDQIGLDGGHALYVEQLDSPVQAAIEEDQTFELRITNWFDAESRQLQVEATAMALAELNGNYSVTVCVVEDHIIGWQTTPGGVNQEYDFRNVFRGTLNGAQGQSLCNGPCVEGERYTVNVTGALDASYNADECYLLVYIADMNQGGKIMQTAMKKIN